MKAQSKQFLLMLLLVVVLLATLAVPMVWAEGEPAPGTVQGVRTYVFYPATALTSNGTVYSSAPRQLSGQDISLVRSWHAVDVFVTVDINGTGTITVTPQFSADQSNWSNADYDFIADTFSLSQVTTVLTGTAGITATSTTSQSSSSAKSTQTYQVVLSADGTDHLRLPIAGEYMRFMIAYTGTLTPTVQATLRNN